MSHSYCRHECPICRNKLHQDNVIADKQFDELISKDHPLTTPSLNMCFIILESIIKERKKEEKLYYQKVAEAGR